MAKVIVTMIMTSQPRTHAFRHIKLENTQTTRAAIATQTQTPSPGTSQIITAKRRSARKKNQEQFTLSNSKNTAVLRRLRELICNSNCFVGIFYLFSHTLPIIIDWPFSLHLNAILIALEIEHVLVACALCRIDASEHDSFHWITMHFFILNVHNT